MSVNLVQYRGAIGNFNNQKFFNTKAVNKVSGNRYWMPANSGTVLHSALHYTKVVKLQIIPVSVYFFSISS